MKLLSSTFRNMEPIPDHHTCMGDDMHPAFRITDIPEEAESLVWIMEDPEAGGGVFTHWTMWNVEPAETIEAGVVPAGAVEGRNDFDEIGYSGPCPPEGAEHTYYFRLYALDSMLDLPEGVPRSELADEMEGHVIDECVLKGTYKKE